MSAVATVKGSSYSRGGFPELIANVGCSHRQLAWWCLNELLPDQPTRVGSGTQRLFTRRDAEAAYAYRQLTQLGAQRQALEVARDAMVERHVDPCGELLIVVLDGFAHRSRLEAVRTADAPAAWIVPLRAFPQFPCSPAGNAAATVPQAVAAAPSSSQQQ